VQRWEYCEVSTNGEGQCDGITYFREGGLETDVAFKGGYPKGWPEALAWLGKEGWEMVGATTYGTLTWYFKRPVADA
jgi:hypothetical protein